MDSQRKDELHERRREEALARRMGEALDQLSPGTAVECPDADVIAAYHERAFGPEENAHWESHFAGCPRCRKILAVLAASVEMPLAENEVARLGELIASTVRSPQTVQARKAKPLAPNRWGWRECWLAPALGVAAVLAMWFAMRPPWRATGPESSGTLIAQAPKNEIPPNSEPTERSSKVVSGQDQKTEAAIPRDRSATNIPSLNSPAGAPTGRRAGSSNAIGKVSPSAEVAETTLQKEKKSGDLSDERAARQLASPPVPPPSPKAQAAMEAPSAAQTRAEAGPGAPNTEAPAIDSMTGAADNARPRDKQQTAPQRVAGAMVIPETSSRVSIAPRGNQNLSALKAVAETSAQMKTPSGLTLWRMGKAGSIERSLDAGRTWTAQASPSREDWLAGAAVSDTVGWIVGRNGSIARTMDGEHWEHVPPPQQATDSTAISADWTGITARDAQIATITASDGRRFATQDGGKTWQPQ